MPADQVPGNGEFLLYPNIAPMLTAGHYTLTAAQSLQTNKKTPDAMPVDDLDVHITVRAPRLLLPPDQLLSAFPPAEREGSFGARLPQVVIKRRTLPWERKVTGAPDKTPWLALVVVAEGEAKVLPNIPAAELVTRGVTLVGDLDAEVGTTLEIRASMVASIFPTKKDVPLLAHARHVDISDTELMMGDDDGFLAVVVANRLPVSARDTHGVEVPVKYTACLINLEGQWEQLLNQAPPPLKTSLLAGLTSHIALANAGMDKHVMGGAALTGPIGNPALKKAALRETKFIADTAPDLAASAQTKTVVGFSGTAGANRYVKDSVIGSMATEYVDVGLVAEIIDPVLRFPVLLSWRFTSSGNETFASLMEGLDIGMLGTVGKSPPAEDAGRLPLELVDTGHVGLTQRTRRGDTVRAWYRGPFVPHPVDDAPASRLPLAHAADQLRIVIPDGREDLSLASAFEIGRLLALANPSMVAALLRWRQLHYVTVRKSAIWKSNALFLGALSGFAMTDRVTASASANLSRAMMRAVGDKPADFLGGPRALVDPGRPLPFEGDTTALMGRAFGLPLKGDPAKVLTTLQNETVRVAPVTEKVTRVPGAAFAPLDRAVLDTTLSARVERIAADAIVRVGAAAPSTARRGAKRRGADRDALDAIIDRLSRKSTGDDE